MSYKYMEHLKKIFSEYTGKGELDIATWRKGGPWTDKFRQPAKALEAIRRTFKPQAISGKSMLSCSTALFAPVTGKKNSASGPNVSDIYEVLFDIDNDEFKEGKDKIDNEWGLSILLKDSRTKLWKKVKEALDVSGLLPYATCISTGSGVHVHFFLSEVTDINQTINRQSGQSLTVREIREHIVKEMVSLLGADPVPSQIQAKGKWIEGIPYTKVQLIDPVMTELLQDAREFLSIESLFDKVLMIKEMLKKDINPHVGLLGEYVGPNKWQNGDGSRILINRDFRMWVEEDTGKTDENGDMIVKQRPIHSSYAVIPKYVIFPSSSGNEDEEEQGEAVFLAEAVNAKKSFMINLPQTAFDAPDKLQKCFVRAYIDLAVERNRRQFFSYFMTHSERIESVEVGRHDDMLVMYDYIYKYGRKWHAKRRIVKITTPDGKELYYIQGADLKRENEKSVAFSKEIPAPEGTVGGMLDRMDKIIKDKNKNRIFMSYLASTLVRDKIIERYKEMPNLNLYGEPATGKTTFLDAACRIFNVREQTAHPTIHNLYRKQANMKNMIVALDDFSDMDYYRSFLKDAVRPSIRPRRTENGGVSYPEIRNSLIMTTNYAVTDPAVSNRMLKLYFSKDGIIKDTTAYSDFDMYVDDNQLSILTDLYERVNNLNWDKVNRMVDDLAKYATEKLHDMRLAKMYAVVLSVGYYVGVIKDPAKYINPIGEVESLGVNEKNELLEVMLDFAVKQNVEDGVLPTHIPRKVALKVNKFTKYLIDINYDKFVTQKTVSREVAPYRSFIIRKRTTITGQGHGVFYMVDFAHEAFRDYFEDVGETLVQLKKEYEGKIGAD